VRVLWSPLALERVEEIARRIAEDRPRAAEAWVEEIFASVRRLEQFPESGRMVPEVRRADVREVIQGKYRVLYRLESEQISVLTVRHSRQQTTPEDLA
jgi:plasmid stabilization system protein ParE